MVELSVCTVTVTIELMALDCRVSAGFIAEYTMPITCTHLKAFMERRDHYHVYVIELSKDVLYEGKFKRCNPDYVTDKPCVYVGMTGLDPDVRFDKHNAGIQSNRYVKPYGLRLLPDLYEGFNPMPYEEACDKEVEIGIDLRSAGFGVWQA